MISQIIINELERDVKEMQTFRNLLIEAGIGRRFNRELTIFSGLLGKVEAIIQLSREGKL